MRTPVVLGIDFGGSKIAVAASDPDGTRLGTHTLAVRPEQSARQTFAHGVDAAQALLGDVAPDRPLIAVGACTFGIPRDDRIDLAPTIAGWDQLEFGHELRRAFPGAEIRTVTDVKAAAEAEATQGALVGHDPGLYVNLGTGLAVAIVTDGVVLTGRHGASGEIGYNLRRPGDAADAPRLEEVIGGKALMAAAGGDVASLLDNDDAARTEFLTELGFHLVNLVNAIDPSRVAVGGGLVRSWDRIGPTLAAALESGVPYPPELVLAEHPFDAPLLGALALAISAAREVLGRRDADRPVDPTASPSTRAVAIEGAPA